VACYREALRLDPRYALAHNNLGAALRAQGDLAGAVRCHREALRLDPKLALAHYNLGNALQDQGELGGAVRCYREALRLDPKYAKAQCGLGFALRQQGRFAESLTAFRRGHELGSRDPRWPYPSAQQVREAEAYAEREPLLEAIRTGQSSPAGPDEFPIFARMCCFTGHPAAAARLYREALALRPPLTAHRYDAACAAALAGCGQGQDAASLDEKKRAAWRRQALEWLRAELAARDKLAATNQAAVRQELQHWQKDADFAGVRGQDALAKLPEAERAAWQKLWADVDALRQRMEPQAPPAPGPEKPGQPKR
jgi:tetratricopeptide (TPR) repeat protein